MPLPPGVVQPGRGPQAAAHHCTPPVVGLPPTGVRMASVNPLTHQSVHRLGKQDVLVFPGTQACTVRKGSV